MSQSIEVVVRLRPSSKGNTISTTSNDIETESAQSITVEESSGKVILNRNRNQAEYTFTRTFGPDADQLLVYGSCDVIPYVLDGVNCCVMTYGQTSTGKTYTMYGRGWEDSNSLIDGKGKDSKDLLNRSLTAKTTVISDFNDNDSVASAHDSGDEATYLAEEMVDNSDHLGIIPRSINDLFDQLNMQRSNKENFAYSISLQIMQIYNEKIYDLLHDRLRKNPLVIRETSAKDNFGSNVYVRGLSVYRIDSKEDAFRLIKKAIRNKVVRSTELNSVSSRSHTVLQLFVMTEDADADGLKIVRRSTLSLIDLAGSEKWRPSLSTTGSVDMDAQVKEMTNINTSLHVLGNCIAGLIESDRKHIPYRDSVLTRLLQSTLGGNGKSIIVATIHSDAEFVDETYSTLQFATRASKVKVTLAQNVGVSEKLSLVEAQKHIKMLKKQLELLRGNPGSTMDLSKSLMLTNSSGDNSVCEQCMEYQTELTALKQRVQSLEQENQFLKQKCEELNLNNSAFYSNQSSVESSPVVKSTKKKKREKTNSTATDSGNGAAGNNSVMSSKDKGIITLTSPMLLGSSLTAEPLRSIPEHRRYGEEHDHHSDQSDLTDTSVAMLTSSLDRALQQQQQSQMSTKANGQSNRNSYDSDSSSISGLHSILQAKSPADIAAAALRNASADNTNKAAGSTYSSISGSILGVPSSNPTISTNHVNTINNNNNLAMLNASATFTPTTTTGLPPPSPAVVSAPNVQQKASNSAAGAVHTPAAGAASASDHLRSSHGSTLLASILGTPITGPISLQNHGGVCQKHNLEDCILCAMFNGSDQSTTNNNSSFTGTSTVPAATGTAAATTGNNNSILSKFSTPIHGTAPSSVTSSITSILKAANNNPNNASIASVASTSFLDDTTPKVEEFGVTTLRRSKSQAPSSALKLSSALDDDNNSGKCKHGLLNCLLCNGIPPFDFSSGTTATSGGIGGSSANAGPSRLHVLPPMAHSSSSGISNTVDMISTLESPHSKSSFPLSSSARSSVQDRWMPSSHRTTAGNGNAFDQYQGVSSSTLMGSAEEPRAGSAGLDLQGDGSHHHLYKSKRVQEIQAITQLRQSHHLEQQQQQLQQKLHPRSSSSPLPVSGAIVGFPVTAEATSGDVPSVRSSLVRQMRTEHQHHHHGDATQQQQQHRPPALRYKASSRHAQDTDDNEEEDDEEEDEEDESYPPSHRFQQQNRKPQQSNITYEDDEDAVGGNQAPSSSSALTATNQGTEKKLAKDPKKKKTKKIKKKKLTSTRGSDTEGSAGYPDRGSKFDPQLFDQLVNQPRPSSKATAAQQTTTRQTDLTAANSNIANTGGNEKVINHRTVMMALKGSKKK